MRNVQFKTIGEKAILDQPMTLMTANAKPAGGIDGTGNTLVIDHTTDNSLVTLRFKHASVRMAAAEEDFEAGGRKFRAGAFIIANADRAALEPTLKELSLTALAVAAAPTVKTHDLDVPRIGYVHSLAADAGRRLGARRVRSLRRALHLLLGHQAARRQPALEVRRHRVPARRRHRAAAGQRPGRRRAGSVQEERADAESRRAGLGRRHPRRHGDGRAAGARELRARGRHAARRRIDDGDLP